MSVDRSDGVFVRVLFGESSYPIRAGILADLDKCIACPFTLPNVRWYVYGVENAIELEKRGIKQYTLLDEEPICRFGRTGDRNPRHNGVINWGVSFWLHKYPPLLDALVTHQDAVYLDLDTLPVKPIPRDFWDQCRSRLNVFGCALRQNSRPRCAWRGTEHVRKTPVGSLLYFRGRDTVENFLQVYDTMPDAWDLVPLAKFADELAGGFWGAERYKELKFEPWFHQVSERGQIFRPLPEDLLFQSGKKEGLRALGLQNKA